jgi:ketosteroid isomerase-like protein
MPTASSPLARAALLVMLVAPALAGAQEVRQAARPMTDRAASPSNKATSEVRRMTEAANARFMAAYNGGDVATFAKVYATDGTVMPSNTAAIHGRPAIQKYWQGGWDAGIRNVKLTTDELFVNGDMATEVGRYQYEVKPGGAAGGADHGKYIVLWKKSPTEGWQWYRDIFNSDVTPKK